MVLKNPKLRRLLFLLSIVFSVSVYSQTTITDDDFESGWGNWNDGGNRCNRDDFGIPNGDPDEFSIEIKDDRGVDSSMTSDDLDLEPYSIVTISFDYQGSGVEDGDNFWVQYSSDGGANWTVIEDYVVGTTDFDGGASISITSCSHTFSDESQFRIISDATEGNDKFYIDNVKIVGESTSEPVIDVVGNGTTLTVGQTTISSLDNTDFGQVKESLGTKTHVYTIENNGTDDLNTISVSLSGDSEFTLDTSSPLTETTLSPCGSTTFSIEFDPSSVATFTGIVSITSSDADRSPYTFAIEGEGSLYCGSYGNTDNDTGITRVIFNTIDNSTSGDNEYSDFTSTTTEVEQALSYDLSVYVNTKGHTDSFTMVWIDWNQNGDFNDVGEEYDLGEVHDDENEITENSPLSILIPSDVLGDVRMRVSSKWDGSDDGHNNPDQDVEPTSCETGFDGEVEDYTITVEEADPYCPSYGDNEFDTGITLVEFNTLYHTSSEPENAYTDNTDLSTTVVEGETHALTVNLNTAEDADGPYKIYARVWIDWNQNGDFDDAGESYDLGFSEDTADGPTSLSPLSIIIPNRDDGDDIELGSTRMRVGAKWDSYPTSCETDYDGEVEDYTIIVGGLPQIDFDGIDDYVDFGDNHDLTSDFSIEAWVLQEDNSGTRTIISKGDLDSSEPTKEYGYALTIESGFPRFKTFNPGGSSRIDVTSSGALLSDKWYHIAVTYNGSTTKLFVDGVEVGDDTASSSLANSSESCFIGAYYDSNISSQVNYFDGRIDEVRIWNVALSETQIREMMNQEIQNVSDNVQGKEIPIDISGSLTWDQLIGYYDMNTDEAIDGSDSGIDGASVNITSSQVQSAPLPYTTIRGGDWDNTTPGITPWTYGDTDWNLPNTTRFGTTIDWNIVKTSDNVDVDQSVTLLGLIVDSGSEFSMLPSNGLFNTRYLKIDGVLDLEGESQLIQTENSYLAEDGAGYLERDQQGTANSYTFNYWCSPVSAINTSENNKSFYIKDVLFDGTIPDDPTRDINYGSSYTFADGATLDGVNPINISSYWFYRFIKAEESVHSWEPVGKDSKVLNVTEGFTMKGVSGSSSISDEQNYVFIGKPNNAPLTLGSLGGDLVHTTFGGTFGPSGKELHSLVGNPFPSAIDADKFIDDNTSSGTDAITGTLYFWEHWGGGSHRQKNYQGGYATYTKAGVTAASSHPDVNQTDTGYKKPGQYIPVGQSFFVFQNHDDDGSGNLTNPSSGSVVFKNSQRVFEIEQDNLESVFIKNANKSSKEAIVTTKKRLWLGFDSSDGFHRQIMVGFMEGATDGIDKGYDGLAAKTDVLKKDAHFIQDNHKFSIVAFGEFDKKREVPISITIDAVADKPQVFKIDKSEGFSSKEKVYIKDKLNNGKTYDISKNPFEIMLEPGEYNDRFSLVFKPGDNNRGKKEVIEKNINAYLSNDNSLLNIDGDGNLEIIGASLFNYAGQLLYTWTDNVDLYDLTVSIDNISSGVYFLTIETSEGAISRKILVN